MTDRVFDAVEDALREAAAIAILPRFRALREGDVSEKSPGEVVTAADGHAEMLIAARLKDLIPGARFVGEEGCAANPRLLDALDDGDVWLVDPLDGTANFAAGRAPFAVMAALLRGGETVAAFMFDPLNDRMHRAALGGGAWIDGRRVRTEQAAPAAIKGALMSRVMSADVRAAAERALAGFTLLPGHFCAGAEYPDIAMGSRHFGVFWRTLPWDHAPGALFLSEAGGSVTRWDGSPYRPADRRTGLLTAYNPAVADIIRPRLADQA